MLGMRLEWIKIDKFGEMAPSPFLLSDKYGNVYVGTSAFDYYDAEYWFPFPAYPFPCSVMNDEWISAIAKAGDL